MSGEFYLEAGVVGVAGVGDVVYLDRNYRCCIVLGAGIGRCCCSCYHCYFWEGILISQD